MPTTLHRLFGILLPARMVGAAAAVDDDRWAAIELHDDQARLHFREPRIAPGSAHEIRRSSDLRRWEVLGRRFAPLLGGIDFVDPGRPAA